MQFIVNKEHNSIRIEREFNASLERVWQAWTDPVGPGHHVEPAADRDVVDFGLGPQHVELALHGHTHLYRYEERGGQTIFNPGECAGHMKGFNAIGVVDLADLSAELLKF